MNIIILGLDFTKTYSIFFVVTALRINQAC